MLGPWRTQMVVGQPLGRVLAELNAFAWQLAGSGGVVWIVGLVGGWLIGTTGEQAQGKDRYQQSRYQYRGIATSAYRANNAPKHQSPWGRQDRLGPHPATT